MNHSKDNSTSSEAPKIVTVTEIHGSPVAKDSRGLLKQDIVRLDSKPLSARRVIVRLENCVVIH
jgi:hypothetical protein